MKYLIINADDFGTSKVFNKSILDLIKNKKIKSTTVLVNRITENQKDQVEELIRLSNKMNLSVGLHCEFQKGNYDNQIRTQFDKFLEIFKKAPSHLDIHKSSELKESIPVVADFCKQKNLPCRNKGGPTKYFKTTHAPSLHATKEPFNKIENWIKALEDEKYYEILFHPGLYDPNCNSPLNKDREKDIESILKLNSILKKNNVKQVSYLDLARASETIK